MNLDTVKHIGRFLLLIAIQVVILNQVYLSGYMTPFIYPLFILMLPFDVKGWVLLLWAFFTGLTVDMFSDTMGMHASATVFMAFLRPFIIRLISVKADFEAGSEPRVDNNGFFWILIYTSLLIFLHHTFLFFIETFRLNELLNIIFRSLLSSVLSIMIIMLAHLLIGKPSRHRRN